MIKDLLRRRDARWLLAGQSLSTFGDKSLYIALAVWVKSLSGSSAAAGLTFFFLALGSVLAPLGGYLADRVRRRPLMIALDLFGAVMVLSLFFVRDTEQIWVIYSVGFLYGVIGAVSAPARSGLLATTLPTELLASANAAFQTTGEGLRLVAPLVGAGLFAVAGGPVVAIVDSVTFVISAGCLAWLDIREPEPLPPTEGVLRQIGRGLSHITSSPVLRDIVVSSGVTFLSVGFSETLIFAVTSQGLHRSAAFVGLLLSFQGVGAIAGGVSAPRLIRRFGEGWLVGVGIAAFGAHSFCLLVPSVPVVAVAVAMAGAGISWFIVGAVTAIQTRTPANLQGRAYSAFDVSLSIPQTASIAAGAALIGVIGFRALAVTMGAICLACAAYLITRRREEGQPQAGPMQTLFIDPSRPSTAHEPPR